MEEETWEGAARKKAKEAITVVRKIASGDKRRLQCDQFDLDLTYITPRIIAMGFPADTLIEQAYRNHIDEVREYLEMTHGENYHVFNVSDKNYDAFKFGQKVDYFGWPDHHAPPLAHLFSLVEAMNEWMSKDEKNVVVVHCKAGKGRTGTAIAAYLVRSGAISDPDAAIKFFGDKRSESGNGINVPSQMRYVGYFSQIVNGKREQETFISPKPLLLKQLIMSPIPDLDYVRGGMRPAVEIVSMQDYDTPIYTKMVDRIYRPDLGDFSISIVFPDVRLCGDIYIRVYHQHDLLVTTKTAKQMMFRFAFHTSFVEDNLLAMTKDELDSPYHGAVDNKNLPTNFQVTLIFDDAPP